MSAAPQVQEFSVTPDFAAQRLRCLWISRDIPFPADAGDKIYSAQLAQALAAHVQLRFLGFLNTEGAPRDWRVDWLAVQGEKRSGTRALFSAYPRIAAMHATAEYRSLLRRELQDGWDAVVIDGYGSGWALQTLSAANLSAQRRPPVIYVSHNHEEHLWRSMVAAAGGAIKKVGVWQNYLKARKLERELIARADLITTITPEDARSYAALAPQTPSIVLSPGYSGPRCASRRIGEATPRRVVLMGSFRWLIKQENLKRLIELADARFAQQGIALDVIGDVPAPLLQELRARVKATQFHGYVEDVSPHFERARLALVPEVVGGGFKLKFLDYIFGRVPVATIASAAAGIPAPLRDAMICRDGLDALIDAVLAEIGDDRKLNELQERAYQAAETAFDWQDCGRQLHRIMQTLRT